VAPKPKPTHFSEDWGISAVYVVHAEKKIERAPVLKKIHELPPLVAGWAINGKHSGVREKTPSSRSVKIPPSILAGNWGLHATLPHSLKGLEPGAFK
jgi:hypothetical protein